MAIGKLQKALHRLGRLVKWNKMNVVTNKWKFIKYEENHYKTNICKMCYYYEMLEVMFINLFLSLSHFFRRVVFFSFGEFFSASFFRLARPERESDLEAWEVLFFSLCVLARLYPTRRV